ncbi:MAG: LysR family transcriptional regulator [Phycisphaerales bacterium]|nr:MAG: LysR family transcriptional regulator [Phycisphaerales bacterium]
MSVLWVISAAGRGVGKTHLALGLRRLLPESVYAKLGQGEPRADRPDNFLTDETKLEAFVAERRGDCRHIVVECNAWAREGRGDIIIYIGPVAGQTDFRDDAERMLANADIPITARGSTRNWRRALRRCLESRALCESVLELLADHRRFLSQPGPAVRCKLWFVSDDLHVFGPGPAALLELADRHGTLREAARITHMSYRHAWDMIKKAEKHLGRRLLRMRPGGPAGGRAELTDEGRHLLGIYQQLSEEVGEFARERFAFLHDQRNLDLTEKGR